MTEDGKTEEEDRAAKGCIVALTVAAAVLGALFWVGGCMGYAL